MRTWTTPVLSGCLAAVCACALSGPPAFAAPNCDTSWAGGDGDWATAANWTNGVPTATTDACIDAGATDTVTVAGAVETQALTVAAGELDLASAAALTVGGDYRQDAASTLAVEIDAGSFSQVVVGGAAALAGTLDVTTAGAQAQGTSFDVVQAATLTGTFDPVSFTGQRHTVDYGASAVTLTPIQPAANTSPPKVFGTPEFGEILHCNEGGWTNSPTEYAYAWKRDGNAIPNAHDVEYQASFVDVGHRISCAVVAFNPLASDPADSEALLIPGAPPPKSATIAVPPAFAPPDTFSPGFAGAPGSVTALTPAAPVPVALRSGNLEPAEGEVLLRLPGSSARVRVASLTSVPVGAVVDTIHGVARLVVPKDFDGGTQRGRFSRGTFYYRQGLEPVRVRHKLFRALVARLILAGGGSVKACARGDAAGFARILDAWGNGRFRVVGRFSSARGSGARWVTRDDCSGTRTTVLQGAVVVTDFATGRTFVLTAGHHHLARGRR